MEMKNIYNFEKRENKVEGLTHSFKTYYKTIIIKTVEY